MDERARPRDRGSRCRDARDEQPVEKDFEAQKENAGQLLGDMKKKVIHLKDLRERNPARTFGKSSVFRAFLRGLVNKKTKPVEQRLHD
jgi:hypothetical protein